MITVPVIVSIVWRIVGNHEVFKIAEVVDMNQMCSVISTVFHLWCSFF